MKTKLLLMLFMTLCGSALTSCEPDEPVVKQGKKPYCYWENGKEVCYDFPK